MVRNYSKDRSCGFRVAPLPLDVRRVKDLCLCLMGRERPVPEGVRVWMWETESGERKDTQKRLCLQRCYFGL